MPDPKRTAASVEEWVPLAKASFERCCAAADFLPAFYRRFFASCPGVHARFAETDLERQYGLLRHALRLLLIYATRPEGKSSLLERVAQRHSRRDLDVDPSLYPCFVDSLIGAVEEFDGEFTPEVEHAWRQTVAPGVEYMISQY